MTRRLPLALACAVLLAGCPSNLPTKGTGGETSLTGNRKDQVGQLNLTSRELKLRDRDGKPLNGVAVQIAGKTYLVRDGVVMLDDQVFEAAKKDGKLVVFGAGFLPLTLILNDQAPGEVVLTATESLGKTGMVGKAGGTLAAAGDRALVTIPADFLTGGSTSQLTGVTVGTYRPVLADDAQAAFEREVAALVAVRDKLAVAGGKPAGSGACGLPMNCAPVSTALGVSLTVDGPVTSGPVAVSVDLSKMTTPEDKAAAQRILDTFAAFDASGDPTWREALRQNNGITLDGTMLTFPVKIGDAATAAGLATVEVDGLAVLGTRLEVTVVTSKAGVGSLKNAVPILPGDVPEALLAAKLPDYQPAPGLKAAGGGTIEPDNGPDAIYAMVTNNGARIAADASNGAGVAQLTAAQLLTNNAGSLIDTATGQLVVVDAEARRGTNLISNNSGGLISNNSGGLISNNTAGLISNNSGGLISNNAGSFIANNSAGIVAQNGAGIISENGAGLIGNNGSQLAGFPFFPFAPEGAKYQLLQVGVGIGAPEPVRTTPTGLMEYLWPGQTRVRAIAADGSPITDWVKTDGSGAFRLTMPKTVPIVFFVQCELTQIPKGKLARRAYALAFAPGKQPVSLVAVDASTTMVATSTLHLLSYIPPEYGRLSGLAASYEDAAEELAKDNKNPSSDPNAAGSGSNRKPYKLKQTADDAQAAYEAALAVIYARTGELSGAWGAFNPFKYGNDLGAADRVITQEQAEAACDAASLRANYDPMYGLATAGKFKPGSFSAINPDSPPIPEVPAE